MPAPSPLLVPPALQDAGLENWHQVHQDTLSRMSGLALDLDRHAWLEVERACRWVRATLHPHNLWEEHGLFPLLALAGATPLQEALCGDHTEMGQLTHGLLRAGPDGQADPVRHGRQARRLLDLIRQHIDTEEHLMLPLLQGRRDLLQPAPAGEGYQTTSPYHRRLRRLA